MKVRHQLSVAPWALRICILLGLRTSNSPAKNERWHLLYQLHRLWYFSSTQLLFLKEPKQQVLSAHPIARIVANQNLATIRWYTESIQSIPPFSPQFYCGTGTNSSQASIPQTISTFDLRCFSYQSKSVWGGEITNEMLTVSLWTKFLPGKTYDFDILWA